MTRVQGLGVLRERELGAPTGRLRHVFGVFQEYEYFDNESQVFAAQILSAGVLSRYSLRRDLHVRTDVTAIVFPLAAIQTVDTLNPETGRTYDFASGGCFRVAARLYRGEWEIVRVGYGVAFAHAATGTSTRCSLRFFRASARLPLTRSVGVGAGYSWYCRNTTCTDDFEPTRTQSEIRMFASLSI